MGVRKVVRCGPEVRLRRRATGASAQIGSGAGNVRFGFGNRRNVRLMVIGGGQTEIVVCIVAEDATGEAFDRIRRRWGGGGGAGRDGAGRGGPVPPIRFGPTHHRSSQAMLRLQQLRRVSARSQGRAKARTPACNIVSPCSGGRCHHDLNVSSGRSLHTGLSQPQCDQVPLCWVGIHR